MQADMNQQYQNEGSPEVAPSRDKQAGIPATPAAGRRGPITWNVEIPLLTNAVVLKQLFFVLGLSSLCVLVFVLSLESLEGDLTLAAALKYFLIALSILGGISFLAVLVMLLLYGNRYEYRFTVDEAGVTAETTGGTRRKNAVVNLLLLLSGKPAPAGAGLLAASRQSEQVKWENVENIETDPARLQIVLRRRGRAVMLMRCTPENYQEVLYRVKIALAHRSG